MSTTSSRLENLSPAKRALLVAALRKDALKQSAGKKIPRCAKKGPVVLSFAQQRLWFIDQLDPGNPAYNCPAAVSLRGPLDLEALQQSFNHLVARHESLRTTFVALDGLPQQIVSAPTALHIPLLDLQGQAPEQQQEEVRRIALAEAQTRFDLQAGPLLRVSLLRLGRQEHVLLLTIHHIISDAWSIGVLVREVAQLYESMREGREVRLAELPIQYGDFAVWQREWMQGAELERQLSYWREQLAGLRGVLELPQAKARPVQASHQGATVTLQLDAELTRELRELSRQQGVTLYMMLLAAFKLLLYRYSGEREVVVGTGIANRNRVETEELIGFFVNMLVLRTELEGEWSFRELVQRVKEVCIGAYAHQDVPFEKLVEELQPDRSLSHTPLFKVVFVLQNAPVTLYFPGLTIKPIRMDFGLTHWDLTFSIEETEDELEGILEYNTSLFDAPFIAQLLKSYETILKEIVRQPGLPLLDAPLVPDTQISYQRNFLDLSTQYSIDQFEF